MTKLDIMVDRLLSDGFILSARLPNGDLFKMRYMDYGIREAKQLFRADYKAQANKGV